MLYLNYDNHHSLIKTLAVFVPCICVTCKIVYLLKQCVSITKIVKITKITLYSNLTIFLRTVNYKVVRNSDTPMEYRFRE